MSKIWKSSHPKTGLIERLFRAIFHQCNIERQITTQQGPTTYLDKPDLEFSILSLSIVTIHQEVPLTIGRYMSI